MTGFLASVRNLQQARLAAAAGADLIDLKDPDRGSLGALPCEEVAAIVRDLQGVRPVSATVGDLPMEPARVTRAVAEMSRTGVNYVKVGISRHGELLATLRALAQCSGSGPRLIAVFFADEGALPLPVESIAAFGFHGCMLDTFDKTGGSLTTYLGVDDLRRFVSAVSRHGLLCGLAGSLRADDIPLLAPLGADYLGFRGALCRRNVRTEELDPVRVANIAERLRTQGTRPAAKADAKALEEAR
jgi:(5-formylfuran-3-yl)methyl phosphate synthase